MFRRLTGMSLYFFILDAKNCTKKNEQFLFKLWANQKF